jgi:hypothetical protein
MIHRRLIVGLVTGLILTGCTHGRMVGNTFVSDDYRFSVALPGPPFTEIPPKGTLVAVSDPATGASIAVSASPDVRVRGDEREVPLLFVARELFISIDKKEYVVSEQATIDGVAAWHLEATGESEGVPLVFSAYVTRFSGTIYDLVFWSRPAEFTRASGAFLEMVKSFRFRRGEAE